MMNTTAGDESARSSRMGGVRGFGFGVNAFLCAAIALFSYRYLLGGGLVPPLIADNRLAIPWLVIHVAGAATALLVSPLQLVSRWRQRWPRLHRVLGRIYVVGCLVGGVAGFALALGSAAGPVAALGFGGLAVAWLATTLTAWRAAMRRQFAVHRAWMLRSFALTYAAVTLRLYLMLLPLLPVAFLHGYRAVSFLCWVPNLIVAEIYLASARSPRRRAAVAVIA